MRAWLWKLLHPRMARAIERRLQASAPSQVTEERKERIWGKVTSGLGGQAGPEFVPAAPARFECDCARCARRLDPLAAVFFGVSFAFAVLVCLAGVAWAVQP